MIRRCAARGEGKPECVMRNKSAAATAWLRITHYAERSRMAQGIRVGIIGAGWPGTKHVEGYKAAGGYQVAAVADLIPSRRKALLKQCPSASEHADAQSVVDDK